MGWFFIERPSDIREYFERECRVDREDGSRQRLVDFAIVDLRVGYGAIEQTDADGSRRVFALVAPLKFCRNTRFDFGYKQMDETVCPCEAECPTRILDLLTDPPYNEFAAEWRGRCREYHEGRARVRRLTKGVSFAIATPLTFGGVSASEFTVSYTNAKSLVCRTSPGSMLVAIRRSLLARLEFVVIR